MLTDPTRAMAGLTGPVLRARQGVGFARRVAKKGRKSADLGASVLQHNRPAFILRAAWVSYAYRPPRVAAPLAEGFLRAAQFPGAQSTCDAPGGAGLLNSRLSRSWRQTNAFSPAEKRISWH